MKKQLLLLHGALGSASQFNRLTDHLSPYFDIHTLDFEGHGNQFSDKPYNISLFTENIVHYLNKNNIVSISIFGYSMGGYVALNLAHQFPDRVNKIITLGTKFHWTPEIAAKETKLLNPEKILEKVPAFAEKLAKEHAENDWKQVMKKTADLMVNLGNDKPLTTSVLEEISHSTLIGIGSNDHMVSLTESEESAIALPNGTLHVFEEFPHPIEKVAIPILGKEIISFME